MGQEITIHPTEWFQKSILPFWEGVYQVQVGDLIVGVGFAKFLGGAWYLPAASMQAASREFIENREQKMIWRGLSKSLPPGTAVDPCGDEFVAHLPEGCSLKNQGRAGIHNPMVPHIFPRGGVWVCMHAGYGEASGSTAQSAYRRWAKKWQ